MKIQEIICILLCSATLLIFGCKRKEQDKSVQKNQVAVQTTGSSTDSVVIINDRDFFKEKEEKFLDSFVVDGNDTLYFTITATADPKDTLTLSQNYIGVTGKKITETVHTINYHWKFQIKKDGKQIVNSTFSKYDFIDTSDYSDFTYWFSNLNFLGYSSFHQLFLFDYWFAPEASDYGAMKTFMVNMKGEIVFIAYSGVSASCGCDVPASFSPDGKYVLMCEQLVNPANKFEAKIFPETISSIVDMGWINNKLFWVLFDSGNNETEVNNLRIYDLTPRGYDLCSFNSFYCELGYSANVHDDPALPYVHFYDHTNKKVILLRRDKYPVIEKIDLGKFTTNNGMNNDSEGVWVYYFENTCMVWGYNEQTSQLEYKEIPISQ